MKKSTLVLALLFSLLVIIGCGSDESAAKNALSRYIDASMKMDYEEQYQFLSSSDKSAKSLEQFLEENSDAPCALGRALGSKASYEIKELTITGKEAKAKVEFTVPDPGTIVGDVFEAVFREPIDGGEEKLEEMLAEKYADQDMPMITRTDVFTLVKEEGGWKLLLGW